MTQKYVTIFSRYNSDADESILIILGTNVTEKTDNRMYFSFQSQLTTTSALPGKMQKQNLLHPFIQMLYYCTTRLQPVASLIYSVLSLATHAHAAL